MKLKKEEQDKIFLFEQGYKYFSLLNRLIKENKQFRDFNLTPTEQIYMSLLLKGLSDKEILEKLCVAMSTVKCHLTHIYQKYQVSGVTQRTKCVLKHLGYEVV